jgi:hypothetical protein
MLGLLLKECEKGQNISQFYDLYHCVSNKFAVRWYEDTVVECLKEYFWFDTFLSVWSGCWTQSILQEV